MDTPPLRSGANVEVEHRVSPRPFHEIFSSLTNVVGAAEIRTFPDLDHEDIFAAANQG
jgi:hypothetical protein